MKSKSDSFVKHESFMKTIKFTISRVKIFYV